MARAHNRLPRRDGPKPGEVFAALDIGCSKITCLIARRDTEEPSKFQLLGGGRQQSRGFEAGTITDMEALERAIRLAVEDAERQSGERIERVVLGVTSPKLVCKLVSTRLPTNGRPVSAKDIQRVQSAAVANASIRDFDILSAHPVAYRIDDQDGVRDPSGMHGQMLGVLVSAVLAPESLLLNLVECVSRAHLDVAQLVPSAIATGMGTLIVDELENGVVCLDLGAGVTTASIFINGVPAWLGLVPAGGAHVTSDIAQGLGTTFAAAERLKTIHGTTSLSGPGSAERIDCPRLGDDGRLQAGRIERGELSEIIAPRVEETLELAAKLLVESPLKKVLPRRGVLTGGASQINGLRDTAIKVLEMPVRLGRPVAIDRLGESYATAAFSTAAGLLSYRLADLPSALHRQSRRFSERTGLVGAVNRAFFWVRENF